MSSDSLQPSILSPSDQIRAKRMQQVMWITFAGTFFTFINSFLYSPAKITPYLLGLCLIAIAKAFLVLRQNRLDLAAAILLWSLCVLITMMIAFNAGLRDSAMLAYPAILILAALFTKRRVFMLLFAYLVASAILFGISHIYEWRSNYVPPISWGNIINICIILIIVGFSVRFQAYDLRSALTRLEKENERYRTSQAEVSYLAHYDKLTGLPNRTLCEDRFKQQLQNIDRHKSNGALLFIDLDNFKTINDSLGHSVGDQVLVFVAQALTKTLRQTDTACRFGGDEFIILLNELHNSDEAATIAKKLLTAICQPIVIDQHYIETSASIGIAMAPADGDSFDSYCKSADIAMYHAKDDGKNLYRFYNSDMTVSNQERFTLLGDLRHAIKNDELRLHYQPKTCLVTGIVIGAEALVRWQHPSQGLLSPAYFIELAEETGLIVDIGNWVLQQACRDCKTWHAAGHQKLEIAVNLSPLQFGRGDLQLQVNQALQQADLDAHFLELEITESLLLMDANNVKLQLDSLRTQGVKFSIDDFGTGYSNLGYLSKFPIESLKIDQSFVMRMHKSVQDTNIVIAIVNIAKSLHLKTIAEGVESAEALQKLTQLGCEIGQGYFWAKPMPQADFLQYIAQTTDTQTTDNS